MELLVPHLCHLCYLHYLFHWFHSLVISWPKCCKIASAATTFQGGRRENLILTRLRLPKWDFHQYCNTVLSLYPYEIMAFLKQTRTCVCELVWIWCISTKADFSPSQKDKCRHVPRSGEMSLLDLRFANFSEITQDKDKARWSEEFLPPVHSERCSQRFDTLQILRTENFTAKEHTPFHFHQKTKYKLHSN